MKEHTIMVFPQFKNLNIIQEIREKYDPLAALVRPHITLVFPFGSELTVEELREELAGRLQECHSFPLKMNHISKCADQYGNYIYLNVSKGKRNLLNLHGRLYSGILSQYKPDSAYLPHLTLGKLACESEMNLVYEKLSARELIESTTFETYVDKISVEEIGPHGESIIVAEYRLSD